MSDINIVLYLDSGTEKIGRNKSTSFAGAHGYTYDATVEGKKKLVKDTPTTMGYFVTDKSKSNNVVNIIDVVSVVAYNFENELFALLALFHDVLKKFNTDEYNNLAVVVKERKLVAIVKANEFDKAAEKMELTAAEIELALDCRAIIEQLTIANRKVIYDLEGSVVGGMGNKKACEQTALACVNSTWSYDEKKVIIDKKPLKEYLEPETDFNKIVSAGRWFFNTGEGYDFYQIHSGYRRYDFGKLDPEKKYYGKATPDVTYSVLYSKEPVSLLDKLYEFTKARIKNPNELLLAGNMQFVKSKDVARLIDSTPGVKKGKEIQVPYKVGNNEEPTLIELIDPPGLSYKINAAISDLGIIFHAFMNRDEDGNFGCQHFMEITDLIFKKEVNKKGVTKVSLNNDFKANVIKMSVSAFHPKVTCKVPITLSIGYDTPERNNFNSVEDESVKVFVALEFTNDKAIIYRTITTTDNWIYIHSAANSNLRVLNKTELLSFIKD